MDGSRIQSSTPWVLAIPAGLLMLVLGVIGWQFHAADSQRVAGMMAAEQQWRATIVAEQARQRAERAAIYRLVREHRPSSSPTWCKRLTEAILEQSRAAEVDPLMIAAIVAQESSFHSRVTSRAGAVGLMQLRPFVAEDVALRGQLAWSGRTTLWDPDANVQLGILYYKELMDRFGGEHEVALTAYNEGPTRVRRKIVNGVFEGSDYARDILALYDNLESQVRRSARDA